MANKVDFFDDIQILPRGRYMQLVTQIKLLDDAIIRSNEPEEVLTYRYESLGDRFIIPSRKVKGKLRRLVMEKQRDLGIWPECFLKESLCLQCPACLLFGGTGETQAKLPKEKRPPESYNLLSRVLTETFISIEPPRDIRNYTGIGVDEQTQQTAATKSGALFTIVTVPAETIFVGLVVLRDPTKELASILCDNLLRLSRLGASTREWGKVETTILGAALTDRETLSAYHLAEGGKEALDQLASNDELQAIETLELPPVEESYRKVQEQFTEALKVFHKKEK